MIAAKGVTRIETPHARGAKWQILHYRCRRAVTVRLRALGDVVRFSGRPGRPRPRPHAPAPDHRRWPTAACLPPPNTPIRRSPARPVWVHVLRNVANRLRLRDRATCLHMARRIYQARSRPAAERALQRRVHAWQATAPKAVATLLRDWDALLAFFAVPDRDWRRVRTTNAIARVFREIRRRTRPMTCFTNTPSCDRIIFAIVHALNLRYASRRTA